MDGVGDVAGGAMMDGELRIRLEQAAASLKRLGAREVYVFGSVLTGTLREGSDVDLAVSGLPPEAYFAAMREARQILEREVDLIDLDEGNPFGEYLREKGKLQRVA
ncbi:MAG: nucleotidyltransferase domain-containing protein [Planctomycetota bacterium]